ncbi:MAG: HAD hydrolase family protein, partial [Eubacterium sp.]
NGNPVTDIKKLNSASYEFYNIDENYRPVIDATRIGVEDLEKYIKENHKIEIFNIFFKSLRERDECAKILEKNFDVCVTTSMDNNIEIMADGVSKGMSLERLCNYLNIDSTNVIAVGDSRNDFSMFDYAGTSLSAGNAEECVREYAKSTVCTNNEHIAKYIYENILEVQ